MSLDYLSSLDAFATVVDTLLGKECSFALYRLSGSKLIRLIVSKNSTPIEIENPTALLTKSGFLLAPFDFPQAKALLIPAHHVFTCSKNALAFSHALPKRQAQAELCSYTTAQQDAYTQYSEAFKRFHSVLINKQFEKLVLSRSEAFTLPADLSAGKLFVKAATQYPDATVSLTYTSKSGLWLGATPEVLLRYQDGLCTTMALAGTMPTTTTSSWSSKNKIEQDLVAQNIRNCIRLFTENISEHGPYTFNAGPVKHIRTDFVFSVESDKVLGEIVAHLHPTPAVCGLPMPQAAHFIRFNEGRNRTLYAGFLGPVDIQNATSLYVNLRCMTLYPSENTAVLHAGGGILSVSELEEEWTETRFKMATLSNLFA